MALSPRQWPAIAILGGSTGVCWGGGRSAAPSILKSVSTARNPSTCQGLRYGYSEWMDGNNTPNDLGSGWGMPQTPNSVSPGDGVWVNVVTTFDSSGDVTMYMNG